ncbi:MAG: hypothetical protein WBP45_02860 [Daejeonella sp.]
MKRILFCALLLLTGLFACKTRKQVTKTQSSKTQSAIAHVAVLQKNMLETQFFGDSLSGNVFVPMPLEVDSTNQGKPEIFTGESGGIKYNFQLKPRRTAGGKLTGHDLNFQLAAKPVAKTNIKNETQSAAEMAVTVKSDKTQEDSDTRTPWWSPPGWVYGLLLLLVVLAIILFYKQIINYFK